jgi:hypothetical protein
MTPLSYQGLGFTTILLMVAILALGQLFRFIKDRHQKQGEIRD